MTNDAIVINTFPGNEEWLSSCLKSIDTSFPVVIVRQPGYELGAIKFAYENTKFDRFLLMQDTIEIKDNLFFDMAFDHRSCYIFPEHLCYFGIYSRDRLSGMNIPSVNSKKQSIFYEQVFNKKYFGPDDPCMFPNLYDTGRFEEKFGRNNMIIENEYFIKYKGTWA